MMSCSELREVSSLTLAYMGDAVYDQYVRTCLVTAFAHESAHVLHLRATRIVRASAQAHAMMAIYEDLTDEERAVYRRGRNANTASVPKNADVGQYRIATGFEAVLGYVYLSGDTARLQALLTLARDKGWKEQFQWQGQA